MRTLIKKLFNLVEDQDSDYEKGWQDGVLAGVRAARVMLLEDLRGIGSTGDYLEVPWADVEALFGTEED